MPQKKAVTPWEKEFARLERRRRAYQARHARPPESRLDRALEDKVPPKLREALNSAFVKAFDLVFQRGTGLLERTFDAEAARQQFEIDQFAAQLKGDRSSLDGPGPSIWLFPGPRALSWGCWGSACPISRSLPASC